MKHRISLFTLIAVMGAMLWCTTVYYPRYNQPGSNATLAWDAAGYYWYLPSIFIYHDLGEQRWADSLIREYGPGPQRIEELGQRVDNGRIVMKYPAGMAVCEAPAFFVAHALAKPLGYPADGFSKPYQVAIQLAGLLVAFVGLILLRRLLLQYFSDGVVACCLAVLVVGTNYLNYSAIDGSIAHNWLFTLYVVLLVCTYRFYRKPGFAGAATIGALCGMAALIRPTDIIATLIPLLWGLERITPDAIRGRLAFFGTHWEKLLLAVLVAGAVVAIQPVYWKAISGHWLVYSYGDQGFSWLHPHIIDYTFSYRSGWLTYTPVMILAFLGAVPLIVRGPQRVMVVLFCAVAFYIVTAWDIWWYAGMGGRAMVQYYPLLMFPVASLLTWIGECRSRIWIAAPVILLLMYVNVWFTRHAHRGSLYDADGGMNRAYYWRVIGRWRAPDEVQKLKDGPYLYEGQTPAGARIVYEKKHLDTGDAPVLIMDSSRLFSPEYRFALKKKDGEQWLRASALFDVGQKEWTVWKMTQFVVSLRSNGQTIRQNMIRVQRLAEEGKPGRLWVDLKLPDDQSFDSVTIHFWNVESKKPVAISDLKVEMF